MRIVTLAEGDPGAVRTWSGIPAFATSALLALGHEVIPYRSQPVSLATRASDRIGLILSGRRYFDHFRRREAKRRLGSFLRDCKPDMVASFANKADGHLVPKEYTLVYIGDATLRSLLSYYDYLDDFSAETLAKCLVEEDLVFQRADHVVMSSDWAARSAIEHGLIDSSSVSVGPFGACLPISRSDYPLDPSRHDFLWCGVDWTRKGGDLAVEAVRQIREQGYDATLYVVGCDVPNQSRYDFVRQYGFLDKENPSELAKLVELYQASLALLLPSKAEAFGMVFCEAAAFGRPSIAYRTGGVASAVIDGQTGFLLDSKCVAGDFAAICIRLINNFSEWKRFSVAAHAYYQSTLNWSAWSDTMLNAAEKMTDARLLPETLPKGHVTSGKA